jgi:hypothetical protein
MSVREVESPLKPLPYMKSIVLTYPCFHSLPKGLRRMLITSESYFFVEHKSTSGAACVQKQPMESTGSAGLLEAAQNEAHRRPLPDRAYRWMPLWRLPAAR